MGILRRTAADSTFTLRSLAAIVAIVLIGDVIGLVAIAGSSRGSDDATRPDDLAGIAAPEDGTKRAPGVGPKGAPTQPIGPSGDAGAPTETTATTLPMTLNDGWDFPVTLAPECGLPGQRFTVTLHLGPEGTTAMSASYEGGYTFGTSTTGQAGPDGTFSYSWVAPPTSGWAMLAMVAGDRGQKNAGRKILRFKIAGVNDPC